MKKIITLLAGIFVLLVAACDNDGEAISESPREAIKIGNITAGRPYSIAIKKGNMLFVSGQVAVDPATGQLVEGTIEAQTEQVMNNLKVIVETAGFSMTDVVKCDVLLADIEFYGAMNAIYSQYFPVDPPARKAFAVKDLPLGALVEIDAVAIR